MEIFEEKNFLKDECWATEKYLVTDSRCKYTDWQTRMIFPFLLFVFSFQCKKRRDKSYCKNVGKKGRKSRFLLSSLYLPWLLTSSLSLSWKSLPYVPNGKDEERISLLLTACNMLTSRSSNLSSLLPRLPVFLSFLPLCVYFIVIQRNSVSNIKHEFMAINRWVKEKIKKSTFDRKKISGMIAPLNRKAWHLSQRSFERPDTETRRLPLLCLTSWYAVGLLNHF